MIREIDKKGYEQVMSKYMSKWGDKKILIEILTMFLTIY
jgi:hypothetical protein